MSEVTDIAQDAAKIGGVITTVASAPSALEHYAVMALVWIAACGLSFGSGYLYRAHVDSVKAAVAKSVVKTADTTIKAAVTTADIKTDATLQKRLNAATSRAASLQAQIEAAKNANPPAASCALPDGLRDTINSQLAGHSGEVQAAVQ